MQRTTAGHSPQRQSRRLRATRGSISQASLGRSHGKHFHEPLARAPDLTVGISRTGDRHRPIMRPLHLVEHVDRIDKGVAHMHEHKRDPARRKRRQLLAHDERRVE